MKNLKFCSKYSKPENWLCVVAPKCNPEIETKP